MGIAFMSAAVPFVFGFTFGIFIGLDHTAAIILGACLSITAEAVSAAILQEMGIFNTYIGTVIIEAGILDDIFEVLVLATIGNMINDKAKAPAAKKVLEAFITRPKIQALFIIRFFKDFL